MKIFKKLVTAWPIAVLVMISMCGCQTGETEQVDPYVYQVPAQVDDG